MVTAGTIIFITVYPFNEDYARKYGFDILKKRGFNIVILNVFNFIYPKASVKLPHYNKLDPVWDVPQIKVKSGKDLECKLKNINGWKMVFLVISRYCILRVLKRAGTDYVKMFTNVQPLYPLGNKAVCERLFTVMARFLAAPVYFFSKSILPKFSPQRLSQRLPYWLFGIKYPKFVVQGPGITHSHYQLSKTRIIKSHSFDYDRFLRNKNKPKPDYIPDDEYYVHIANHPWGVHDTVLLGMQPVVITKVEYAEVINGFFDLIEKSTGKIIIIAAYPKATRDENIYEGRPFLYDTEQLIKYSSGVFCHSSGAIKFAIIHRKPVCFITMTKLVKFRHLTNSLNSYASALKSKIYHIDKEEDLKRMMSNGIFSYGQDVYDEYMRKYVKNKDLPDKLLWDIVVDRLLEDYKL